MPFKKITTTEQVTRNQYFCDWCSKEILHPVNQATPCHWCGGYACDEHKKNWILRSYKDVYFINYCPECWAKKNK